MNHKIITAIMYAILTTLMLSCGASDQGDDPMILVFNTSYGEGTTVTLPIEGEADVTIDWGDGHMEHTKETGLIHHTYEETGRFTVRISGSLSHFGTGATPYPNVEKLRRVESFGNLGLESLSGAFNQASLLVSLPDSLPASVTDLSWLFAGAELFNLNIENWNTGKVTDMTGMFSGAASFNQPLNNWDTGRVTDMREMFAGAASFNQPLGNWDVSNVTNMAAMFRNAGSFDQPLGQWNISQVTNMEDMFSGGSLSPENYNDLLTGWTTLPVRIHVTFHAGQSMYSSEAATSARRNLIERNQWTIFDGRGHHIMAVSQNGRVEGQGSYPAGDTISLRAIPDPGYRFSHWEGWYTDASEDPLHTIVVDGNLTLRARFNPESTNHITAYSDTIPAEDTRQHPADTAKKRLKDPEKDPLKVTEKGEQEDAAGATPELSELDHKDIELWFRMDEPFSDYYFVGGKYQYPDTGNKDMALPEVAGLRLFVLTPSNEFLYVSPAYPNALRLQADVFRHTTDGYIPSHEVDKDSHTPVQNSPLIIVTDASYEHGSIGGHIYFLENGQARQTGRLNIARFHYNRNLEEIYDPIGEKLIIEKEGDTYLFRFDTGQVAYRPRQNGERRLDASSCYYRYDGNRLEFVVEDRAETP